MKYNKSVEKIYDKIRGNSYYDTINKAANRLSTGGSVERSIKKRTGDITNKNIEKRYGANKIYKAIEKAYLKILQQDKRK